MPNGKNKGNTFERLICKELSLWWTDQERDDVFWRSASSGGRATQRFARGKTTAGACGDICAVDPIGEPLLKLVTIELKRGKSHGEPGDVLDCKPASLKNHKWIQTMLQAIESARQAGTVYWLIIVQRDRRNITCFFPTSMMRKGQPFGKFRRKLTIAPAFRYRLKLPDKRQLDFVGIPFKRFMARIKPAVLVKHGR